MATENQPASTDQVPEPERITTTDMVYRSVCEHRELGKACSRASLQKTLNLPLTTIDDRIKYLRDIGQIRLAGGNVAGLYEPTEDPLDDRAVTTTILRNGKVKLEVGDTLVEMTQREARHAGALLAGLALQFRGG